MLGNVDALTAHMITMRKSTGVETTSPIAAQIETLRKALKAEYHFDFAFVILANGRIIGANNYLDGEVIAKGLDQ